MPGLRIAPIAFNSISLASKQETVGARRVFQLAMRPGDTLNRVMRQLILMKRTFEHMEYLCRPYTEAHIVRCLLMDLRSEQSSFPGRGGAPKLNVQV